MGKWSPIPEKYNIPFNTFCIPKAEPLLYCKCKTKKSFSNIATSEAQIQTIQDIV
ncbi:MAG: hypothetical protein ACJA0E_000025 [Bermanella sp.]|jgi:hypothetical protein